MKENKFPGKDTQFGFTWGPAEVTRICSDKKFGIVMEVRTPKQKIQIRVTPKGFIKIYDPVEVVAQLERGF